MRVLGIQPVIVGLFGAGIGWSAALAGCDVAVTLPPACK